MIYFQLNFNKKHLQKTHFSDHPETLFPTKRQTPPLSIDKFLRLNPSLIYHKHNGG